MKEKTVQELKAMLDAGTNVQFVDVREQDEVDVAKLPQAKHIPLGELADRIGELDANKEVIVTCRSGGRSGRAVQYLEGQGFKHAFNLQGGMKAWSSEIDPTFTVA